MKLGKPQNGFSLIELVIILMALGVVVLAGIKVYGLRTNSQSGQNSTAAVSATNIPTINSASDLDKVNQTLDDNDPASASAADTAQLDKDLSNL